jgi:hypothetical protein
MRNQFFVYRRPRLVTDTWYVPGTVQDDYVHNTDKPHTDKDCDDVKIVTSGRLGRCTQEFYSSLKKIYDQLRFQFSGFLVWKKPIAESRILCGKAATWKIAQQHYLVSLRDSVCDYEQIDNKVTDCE